MSSNRLSLALIERLPKVDLHVHLDGSLRIGTLLELAAIEKIDCPFNNLESFNKIMNECTSLVEYLRIFEYTTGVMQNAANIQRVAFELAEDAHKENVKYIEVRFCPQLHTRQGLSAQEAVRATLAGLEDAREKLGIRANVIICCMRSMNSDHSKEMSALAVEFAGYSDDKTSVVAFDLAGDESYSARIHQDACTSVRENNLAITIHAGEAQGAYSVAEAVHICGAKRIGHGVRLQEDARLLKFANDYRITLECCPTSNAQTGAVESLETHPMKAYLEKGMRVTVNTDNRLMSHTTVSKELLLCHLHMGLSLEDIQKVIINGFKSCFCSLELKRQMLESAVEEIKRIIAEEGIGSSVSSERDR